MTLRALLIGGTLGTALSLAACSGSSNNGTTSNSGTTGQEATSTSTTGRHTSSGGVSTGSYTSSGGTSTGTTTGGSTGSSSTGTGTGTSTGASGTGTTSSGTTTGTTGYVSGPPYSGYDSGMPVEGSVAQGCTPAAPYRVGGYCVGCRNTSDCPSGTVCDSTSQCVACRSAADCPMGQICNRNCFNINVEPYEICDVGCQLDCRTPDAGPNYCNPGACDGDAGGCLTGFCYQNSDCVVNGQGACDFSNAQFEGHGVCAACTTDAGGCGQDQLCVFDPNTGSNFCQLSCLIDAGVCGNGTYCSDAGSCQAGCQNSNDCIGSGVGSICHQGQCVGCITAANCPDYNSGCNPQYQSSGSPTCGYCGGDLDCPAGLHCETNKSSSYYTDQCACHADSECPPDAPVCAGLNAALGFPAGSGRCACTDSSQCPSEQGVQFICEQRYPFTVFNGSYGAALGGACIAPCNVDLSGTSLSGTDCSSAGIGQVNPQKGVPYGTVPPPVASVCNSSTGYCVPCAQDTDCYSAPNSPALAPNCVAYPNGLDPTSGEPTGGGQCGCSDTSQCNDGYACWNAGVGGSCQPSCSITDGVDSCNPYREYPYYSPPSNPFCNTWTGACVQCLDDWGCTNVVTTYVNGFYTYPGFRANKCSPNGTCVGCSSDADCPSSAPNCTEGYCGFCNSDSQCYGDAGFTCLKFDGTQGAGTCMITGCVGDSNENATDAGTLCPSASPYCAETEICSNTCSFPTICAQCRPDYYPPYDRYWGDCVNGECENTGTCYYFN